MRAPAKTAATYSRFSTAQQDARSIDDQQRRCRAFADSHGLTIVGEYADAAVSGATTDREDLRRLRDDARRGRFSVVLVDDSSRLSRNLGTFFGLVFDELLPMGVVVLDCMTGMRSDQPGARLVFGATGLVNDSFLEMVRSETHRGLQGRALGGFWTGGRVYGYSTEPRPNPQKPDQPLKVPVINASEAAVVLRIFQDFADGRSLQYIANVLNEERLPAPHDGGKGNKGVRGWPRSSSPKPSPGTAWSPASPCTPIAALR